MYLNAIFKIMMWKLEEQEMKSKGCWVELMASESNVKVVGAWIAWRRWSSI
jgi:hypothetical protein